MGPGAGVRGCGRPRRPGRFRAAGGVGDVGSREMERSPKLVTGLPWGFRDKKPILNATLVVGFKPLR
jgi:hypothetical protein